MNLLIINGSPKKIGSNTEIMLNALRTGLIKSDFANIQQLSLSKVKTLEELVMEIDNTTHLIVGFPLYGNAMPAGLLELFEQIEESFVSLRGKHIGFMVQYGFPEAIHARPIEQYFKDWTIDRGANYSGTIIKGGCDGLSKIKNLKKNHKVIKGLHEIGQSYSVKDGFNLSQVKTFAGIEQQRQQNQWVMNRVVKVMNHFYWKKLLKKNNVTEDESFAKPYGI